MIEDPQIPNPVGESLAERARLDLSLVRHVHAQALATTDPDQINGLGRTDQRIARSLRQTLALQAKLAREAQATRDAARRRHTSTNEIPAPDQAYEVADAVNNVIWAEHEHEPLERERLLDDLSDRLDYMVRAEAFDGQELTNAIVSCLCEELGLPHEHAIQWEDLPRPPEEQQVCWDFTRRGPS